MLQNSLNICMNKKFYISYWSIANKNINKNLNDKKIKKYVDKCFFLLSRFYKDINLITDSKGEKLLKNNNWNSISTILDLVPKEYKDVWSLGKLYAINSMCQNNFIHIDYDFFIYKKIQDDVLNCKILTQSLEPLEQGYIVNTYNKLCKNKYYGTKPCSFSYNCGIVGGNDYEFFKKYTDTAIQLVLDNQNKDFWLKKIPAVYWSKAALAEQYYFALCLNYFNKKPTLFFDNYKNKVKYNPIKKDFYKKTGAVHIYGDYKYVKNKNYKYLVDKLL